MILDDAPLPPLGPSLIVLALYATLYVALAIASGIL